jgi:hypothetical protein
VVEGEGELGGGGAFSACGGDYVGVDDGVGVESAGLVDDSVSYFEPDFLAGLQLGGVDAGDLGFDGGVGRDAGFGEGGTGKQRRESGRRMRL